jgi:hypothetical protein
MNLFCYADNQMKELCDKDEDGECLTILADAAAYRAERTEIPFIYMRGGSTELGRLMDHTRDFDKGMHQYREAVRNGEQPDSTTLGGVEKARRREESLERGRKKLAQMEAEAA